MYKLW